MFTEKINSITGTWNGYYNDDMAHKFWVTMVEDSKDNFEGTDSNGEQIYIRVTEKKDKKIELYFVIDKTKENTQQGWKRLSGYIKRGFLIQGLFDGDDNMKGTFTMNRQFHTETVGKITGRWTGWYNDDNTKKFSVSLVEDYPYELEGTDENDRKVYTRKEFNNEDSIKFIMISYPANLDSKQFEGFITRDGMFITGQCQAIMTHSCSFTMSKEIHVFKNTGIPNLLLHGKWTGQIGNDKKTAVDIEITYNARPTNKIIGIGTIFCKKVWIMVQELNFLNNTIKLCATYKEDETRWEKVETFGLIILTETLAEARFSGKSVLLEKKISLRS